MAIPAVRRPGALAGAVSGEPAMMGRGAVGFVIDSLGGQG
jgi:hypothetical protein